MSEWSRSWSLLQWWSWRLLWWSDECVRATDLWAESDGSGWAALLWWGGLYSQHQPMIIMITSQLCPPESKDTKSATHIYQVGLFSTVSFQISPLGIVLPQRHHEVIQRVVLPTLWTLNRLSGKPIFSVHSRKISEGLWIVVGSFLMSLQCWTIILHFQTF